MIVVAVSWADTQKQSLNYRIWNQDTKRWACYYKVPLERAIAELKPHYLDSETHYLHVSRPFLEALLLPRLTIRERNIVKRNLGKHTR
jgi:hypothetical protein